MPGGIFYSNIVTMAIDIRKDYAPLVFCILT